MTPSAWIPGVPVNGRPLCPWSEPQKRPTRPLDAPSPRKTTGLASSLSWKPRNHHLQMSSPFRTAVGLNTLHQAIARDFPEAVRTSRGHWECNTHHTATRLASIVGKDQYESPWSVVSVLKEKEGINFDACATPFSAVSPNTSVEFNHCHQIIPMASRPRPTPYILDHSFHLPIQHGRCVKISVLMSCTPRASQ